MAVACANPNTKVAVSRPKTAPASAQEKTYFSALCAEKPNQTAVTNASNQGINTRQIVPSGWTFVNSGERKPMGQAMISAG